MSTENLFDVTLNLYKDSKSKSITLDCIRSFLNNEAYQKSFVAHINKLLGASSSRLDGLQLLVECFENISANVLSEQGPFWVKCCLTNYEHSKDKEVYLKTLRSIIECSQKHSEFSRKFATEFLTPILDISLNSTKDLCTKRASLECLTSCLKYYSSFCKHHKKKIEDYLLSFLESSLDSLVADSGIAFIYCQKIPTIGNNTISCMNNLTLSVRKLCVTCHRCLDEIFEQWLEIERFEMEDIKPYDIINPPLHYNSYLKVQYRTQVIVNILQWFITFLSEGIGIIVYPEEILSVLARGLSLHKCSKQISIETQYFSSNLMLIQTKILQVLCVKTLSLKERIAPFFPHISEILRDVLNKSKNCECYKYCKLFQEYFYELLLKLLLIGHGLEKPLQNALVSQIIANNTPSDEGVTIRVHANLAGKSSKSKQNIILGSIASKNNGLERTSPWTKDKLEASKSYLEGLLILMKDNFLDSDILQKITCFLINNILLLQKGNVKAPFNVQHSQELLYEILCSVFEHDDKNIFLNYGEQINKIFVTGCINDNLNISATCYIGLRNMEKVFQALKNDKCSHVSEYSETPRNFEPSEDRINYLETKTADDIGLGGNEIKILENSVLVPAKIKIETTNVLESETKLLEEENDILEDTKISINLEDEIPKNCEITTNLKEENLPSMEENLPSMEENCEHQDLHIEPVPKKRKVEENIADLFSNEFNEDYK